MVTIRMWYDDYKYVIINRMVFRFFNCLFLLWELHVFQLIE